MAPTPTILYRCPAPVRWVYDDGCLIVVDAEAGASFRLEGLAAAVWAWLALGHTYDRLLALVAATLPPGDDPARAAAELDALLAGWVAWGLLRPAEEATHG
jgi:hypothetical protein